MKKLIKTTALILSAVMLFGCTSNSVQGGVGDTTPPRESSVTDSKDESSVTENSSATDNSSNESDENLVKNIEGYQTFLYDSSIYEVTNTSKVQKMLITPYDYKETFEPNYSNFKKILKSPAAIKCHVVGDSYFISDGKCGDVEFYREQGVYTCVYTPVIIDEIIDDFGVTTDYKVGDIVYVWEDYCVYESYNGNNPFAKIDNTIKDYEKELSNASDSYSEEVSKYLVKTTKAYREYLSSNKAVTALKTVLLEKGQSYLMILDKKSNGFVFDNNQYVDNYNLAFDLENDVPKVIMSEEEDEDYFNYYPCYVYQWEILKEKYGEHFKS